MFSIAFSYWAAYSMESFILTVAASAVEVITVLYYFCSTFPGGRTGMNALGRASATAAKQMVAE